MKRFGQGADLVDLDQNRVGDPAFYALFETADIGDEEVVADELNLAPEPLGQELPSIPVVFGHAVLDADDRVSADPSLVKVDELQRGERHPLARELVVPVGVQLAGRDVERERDIVTRFVPGLSNGLDDELQSVFVRRQVRRESPLVTDCGGKV